MPEARFTIRVVTVDELLNLEGQALGGPTGAPSFYDCLDLDFYVLAPF